MLIDLHAHVVPDHFPPAGNRASADRWPSLDHFEPGRARVMIAGRNFRTIADRCWSHPRRLADLEAEGVDRQVISPMPELFSYTFTPEDGRAICRYVNEFVAGLVQTAPDRYYGLGQVPLQDPDLAARELAEVQAAGLLGIEIGSNVLGQSLGEARFRDFFREVERRGLAVFVHAFHPTMTDRIGASEALINAIGFPTDTGLAIASLISEGVLDDCPNLRLAFSHGGGTFPWLLTRFEHAWSWRWNGEPPDPAFPPSGLRERLAKSPTDYARTLYYDTLVFDRRAIRYLIDLIGYRQLMVGTDYPFMPREQPVGTTLRSLNLSEAEWLAIAWQNCLRLLGLPEHLPA